MQRRDQRYIDNIIPKDWRSFAEIRFRIYTNVPTGAETTKLREIFAEHGNVHKIKIETTHDDKSKGVAYVNMLRLGSYD